MRVSRLMRDRQYFLRQHKLPGLACVLVLQEMFWLSADLSNSLHLLLVPCTSIGLSGRQRQAVANTANDFMCRLA